jgi:hypothetical protein
MRPFITLVLCLCLAGMTVAPAQDHCESYPYLCNITQNHPEVQQQLFSYFDLWSPEGAIQDESSFQKILDKQKEVSVALAPIVKPLLEAVYPEDFDQYFEIMAELQIIGFSPFMAADTLYALTAYPHLYNLYDYYCSGKFQIYLNYLYAKQYLDFILEDAARGSYWFWHSFYLVEIINQYREMLVADKNSQWLPEMRRSYEQAVGALYDFHVVETPDTLFAHVNGILADPQNGMVSGDDSYLGLEYGYELLDSLLAVAVNYPSIILTGADYKYNQLHLISVASHPGREAAEKARISYLHKGKDILHVVEVEQAGKKSYHNVYRFFTSKKTAGEALARAKKLAPSAKIIKVDCTGKVIK